MKRFEGKVAVVTGGAKGNTIGYACARALAYEGADLVVVGRKKGALKAGCELEQCGVKVLPLQVAQTSEELVEQALERIVDTFGRIDVLVNCAQASKAGTPVAFLTQAELELALNTGLKAALLWMRQCYPQLRKSHGAVVNIGSRASREAIPGLAALAASRAGLEAASRIAAQEWASEGIRVNTLCGWVATKDAKRQASKIGPEKDTVHLVTLDEFGQVCVNIAAGSDTGTTRVLG